MAKIGALAVDTIHFADDLTEWLTHPSQITVPNPGMRPVQLFATWTYSRNFSGSGRGTTFVVTLARARGGLQLFTWRATFSGTSNFTQTQSRAVLDAFAQANDTYVLSYSITTDPGSAPHPFAMVTPRLGALNSRK